MNYHGNTDGHETALSIGPEGLSLGKRFLNYADVVSLRPVNHRVFIETVDGKTTEISMLGFSYDGFWEELMQCFGNRSMESLFVEESVLMNCEGEYQLPQEQGRGKIILLRDAICILPQTCHAVRIPLCFTEEIRLDGYMIHLSLTSGASYCVGRMGYDTKPFAERAEKAAAQVKKERAAAISQRMASAPFTHKGLFRTAQTDQYWLAGFGKQCCALELVTDEDAATYLYRFEEPQQEFVRQLEYAMEAVGIHREVISCTEEQLQANPLFRMAVERCEAVRFLRSKFAGRLIHSANHAQKLNEFLN